MQPSDCTIYAVCIPGEQVRYEAQSCIVPIMGGAHALIDEEREALRLQGYVFDDENAFLSRLNNRWGELSCVSWIMLNAKQDNIGNAQYRRNWLEPKDQWYDGNTLYFPEPALFNCTLEQQFYGGHFDFDAPAITRDIADSGEWIFSRKEIDCIWSQNSFIGCNMARGASTHYKQFMGALLAALEPIWKKHKEQFLCIEGYDKRALAFIAERLITGMVLYREKLFPSMNIATAPIGFVP